MREGCRAGVLRRRARRRRRVLHPAVLQPTALWTRPLISRVRGPWPCPERASCCSSCSEWADAPGRGPRSTLLATDASRHRRTRPSATVLPSPSSFQKLLDPTSRPILSITSTSVGRVREEKSLSDDTPNLLA